MNPIDWKNLPFGYFKTDYNVRYLLIKTENGAPWRSPILKYINMHMAATCLHYGQEAFEGMKAFTG